MVMSDIAPSYIMLLSCLCGLSGRVLVLRAFVRVRQVSLCVCAWVMFWMSEDIMMVGVCLVW